MINMNPRLVIALFCLTVSLFAQPNNSSTQHKDGSAEQAQTSTPLQNDQKAATEAKAAEGGSPHWYAALKRPDWWLVIIAALTGIAIALQAREMAATTKGLKAQEGILKESVAAAQTSADAAESSADAALRSVKLQEAQLKQWVEIDGWEIQPHPKQNNWMMLGCDIRNPTTRPLTLKEIYFGGQWEITLPSRLQGSLPPAKSYRFGISCLQLDDGQLADFDKDRLRFAVKLRVDFEDAMGILQPPQEFTYICVCGRNRACKVELSSMRLASTEQQQRQ